jgi:hypothetical protein
VYKKAKSSKATAMEGEQFACRDYKLNLGSYKDFINKINQQRYNSSIVVNFGVNCFP